MITKAQTKHAIEFIKDLNGIEHTHFTLNVFYDHLPQVSKFLNGGHYKIINRTERIQLNYYALIAYKVLLDAYGKCATINTTDLETTKKLFFNTSDLDSPQTNEPELEQHLKLLIHGDTNVRNKSCKHLQSAICSFISLYLNSSKKP